MKYVAVFIAGFALTGCDVTFGADGPVVVQSDNVLSQIVPLGTRSTSETDLSQPTVANASSAEAPDRPIRIAENRAPVILSGVPVGVALPLGVARVHVENFKSAVADEGCVIATRQQRAAVQRRTGFTDERIERIIGYVWRTGELERNSGNYTLTSDRCADA